MAVTPKPVVYLGIDVGKRTHSACAMDSEGGIVFRSELENRSDAIDRLLEQVGPEALVVVDQKRNIGALVLARAREHGNKCAYLPGYAEKQARDMMPGIAKTDLIDAEVIARTAHGMPWALRAIAEEDETMASLRIASSQREFATSARTRAKNRIRALLLEADPELEEAIDPSCSWQMSLLAEFKGPFGCAETSWRKFSAAAKRAKAPIGAARKLWELLTRSAKSGRTRLSGEDMAIQMLARDIVSLDAEILELDNFIQESLAESKEYKCLLTVPGIGPKTAAALLTSIDISMFKSHNELASYCGVAPADSRSGSSIRSTSPQRGGNKQLKNLLIFSCNSLIGTDTKFGKYYDECKSRGMRHNKALKAVARKRLKVIFAIIRDVTPYVA